MGKDTGFMDYKRANNTDILPLKRIKNFSEFHRFLPLEVRKEQAARCMNCGVPMCQSAMKLGGMFTGCPLHNYIPEWNDALYKEQFDMAAWRLLKTSSFPEFTGRVCPALCEKACNLGSTDLASATSVHDNELYIIEKAFSSGYMEKIVKGERSGKKVAVIGSGPSGLAVADLLNKRGHFVTVFEKENRAGGLLIYGIPNMKLDKRIVERRIKLMEKEGVSFILGTDIGKDSKEVKKILEEFDAVVLAIGAKNARPLTAKGADCQGVMFAVDFLKEVTSALFSEGYYKAFTQYDYFSAGINTEEQGEVSKEQEEVMKKIIEKIGIKGKNIIILGGGDTGNDCTGSCIRLGAASVKQLEMMPSPPLKRTESNPWPEWPRTLKTDYGAEEAIALYGEDPRVYKTTIKEVLSKEGKVCAVVTKQVEFKNVEGRRVLCDIDGSEKTLKADLVLVAAGFLGACNYAPLAFGAKMTARGGIEANEGEYKTAREGVFSAGDCRRGQSLVVWAIEEGRACAREVDKYLMGYSNL